ncbi:MAG: LamG-like jellyroll fold domain-containing protein [Kiritimatiellia bacterium]
MIKTFPIAVSKSVLYKNWTHYALVYDHTAAEGLGTWELFINSESHGVITNISNQASPGSADGFHLGGDGSSSEYFNSGAYDYWRISDQALSTNEFLNAGTASFDDSPKTLAFYRLDSNQDGSFDLSNRVANAWHLQASEGDASTLVTANDDQAAASVPNPDASECFLGNRTVNQGSLTFRTSSAGQNSYLLNPDGLGYHLGTNSPWTVETWIKMTSLTSRQIIFDVKAGNGSYPEGWMFMNYNGLNSRYCLYFGSTPGYIGFPDSTGGTAETPLDTWHHLVLTFDPVSGPGYQGVWECFLNSRSLGRIEYSNSYTRVNSSANFYAGGRATSNGDAVYGSMDLLRVSRGVLTTNHFLNAGGYVATTNAIDTLAYWKLDSDGSWINTSSQVDSRYSLNNATNAAVAGSTVQCRSSILNPDASEDFNGDPASNQGSVLITNRSALTVGNLGTRLELDRAFTIEGWMKWNNDDARNIQSIAGTKFDTESGTYLPPVGTANRILYSVDSGWLLTLEKSGDNAAFHISCTTAVTNEYTSGTEIIDADLAVLSSSSIENSWVHIALTYEPDENDVGRWTLYLDGEESGAAYNAAAPFHNHDSHRFLLGGQNPGETSFDGYLDCWRVSAGLLSAEDLLYVHIPGGTVILVK